MKTDPNKPSKLRWFLVYVFPPIAIILIVAVIAGFAIKMKPTAEKKEPEKRLPTVETFEVSEERIQITVQSQGTVIPRTETTLIAEVGGRVIQINPNLYAGGRFKQGDVLAKIDPTDYEAAVAMAEARLADAAVALEQEKALAQQAAEDWKLIRDREPTALALREPQIKRAQANYESAKIAVEVAKRDLERTTIRAPYDGISREKMIDIGQFASPRTTTIARIYGTNTAEIRLPLSVDQLAHLPGGLDGGSKNLTVELSANLGGRTQTWEANIDRIEGAIDPQTRMAYAVAQVKRPYDPGKGESVLPVGLFVKAKLLGEVLEDAFELPRKALKANSSLYLIRKDNTIEIRPVQVYHSTETEVVIREGLEDGERICLTELQYAIDGMEVEISNTEK